MSNEKVLVLHHHLGLGDHFICNGLVRFVANENSYDWILLPVKINNYRSVSQMYRDLPLVKCWPVCDDSDVLSLLVNSEGRKLVDYARIGFKHTRLDWDVSFYDSINLPFDNRWSRFGLSRNRDRELALASMLGVQGGDKFLLIHDEGSTGRFTLELPDSDLRRLWVKPLTDSILDWCGLIETASWIHCIDSSFIHLAQSLRNNGTYHNVGRADQRHRFVLREGWSEIMYKR